MVKMASADIMCVGNKSVREKFTGIIRYIFGLRKQNFLILMYIYYGDLG